MLCRVCRQSSCSCHDNITRSITMNGRFCNQIIRNMAISFIAEKIDLYVEYANYENIISLGIPLYVGKNVYSDMILIENHNYFEFLKNPKLINVNLNYDFFQSIEFSQMFYNYLRSESIKLSIIEKNPFKYRYKSNNDCFVHVRLGDIVQTGLNLNLNYYLKAINEVGSFDRLYIASDSPNHEIVQTILKTFLGRSELVLENEVKTIQFGSACRNVVLSHGSFSAIIGWLSFYSDVYYPEYGERMWHGDMFSVNPDWHKITNYW